MQSLQTAVQTTSLPFLISECALLLDIEVKSSSPWSLYKKILMIDIPLITFELYKNIVRLH